MIIQVNENTQAGKVSFKKGQKIKVILEKATTVNISVKGKVYSLPKDHLASFTNFKTQVSESPKGTIGKRMNKDSSKYKKQAEEILNAIDDEDEEEEGTGLNEAEERRMSNKIARTILNKIEEGYTLNELATMLDKVEPKSKVTTSTEEPKWMSEFKKMADKLGYTKGSDKDESGDTNKKEADGIKSGVGTKTKVIKEMEELESGDDLDSFLDGVEGEMTQDAEGSQGDEFSEDVDDMDDETPETETDLSMVEDDLDNIANEIAGVLGQLSDDDFIDENTKKAVFDRLDELLEAGDGVDEDMDDEDMDDEGEDLDDDMDDDSEEE